MLGDFLAFPTVLTFGWEETLELPASRVKEAAAGPEGQQAEAQRGVKDCFPPDGA